MKIIIINSNKYHENLPSFLTEEKVETQKPSDLKLYHLTIPLCLPTRYQTSSKMKSMIENQVQNYMIQVLSMGQLFPPTVIFSGPVASFWLNSLSWLMLGCYTAISSSPLFLRHTTMTITKAANTTPLTEATTGTRGKSFSSLLSPLLLVTQLPELTTKPESQTEQTVVVAQVAQLLRAQRSQVLLALLRTWVEAQTEHTDADAQVRQSEMAEAQVSHQKVLLRTNPEAQVLQLVAETQSSQLESVQGSHLKVTLMKQPVEQLSQTEADEHSRQSAIRAEQSWQQLPPFRLDNELQVVHVVLSPHSVHLVSYEHQQVSGAQAAPLAQVRHVPAESQLVHPVTVAEQVSAQMDEELQVRQPDIAVPQMQQEQGEVGTSNWQEAAVSHSRMQVKKWLATSRFLAVQLTLKPSKALTVAFGLLVCSKAYPRMSKTPMMHHQALIAPGLSTIGIKVGLSTEVTSLPGASWSRVSMKTVLANDDCSAMMTVRVTEVTTFWSAVADSTVTNTVPLFWLSALSMRMYIFRAGLRVVMVQAWKQAYTLRVAEAATVL